MKSFFRQKFLLSVFLGFSVITFSFAKSISSEDKQAGFKAKGRETSKSYDSFFPNPVRKMKARGVVIRFHRWPGVKQQKETSRILRATGLKKTRSIKSFKAQLFEWKTGGLKPSEQAKRACVRLKSLSHVRRCRSDHLLSSEEHKDLEKNSNVPSGLKFSFLLAKGKDETEASFTFECKTCKNPEMESVEGAMKAMEKISDRQTIKSCGVISGKRKLMEGKLSDYWAQELIGSDLLREELKKTNPPEMENWIAVFDYQEENHNIDIRNLISDDGPHAVLPELEGRKVPFLNVGRGSQNVRNHRDYRKGRGYKPALSLYETSYPGDYLFGFKGRAPHYINNSMKWHGSQNIYEVFQKLSSSGVARSIAVLASGNDFPEKLDDMKSKASKDFDVILVGSFAPRGFASDSSQSGREVAILAPSDEWITSADEEGKYKKFGGTSGAAPLVTGSLAAFEWLSGYHPTAKEAKILLERTALPTLHSFEKPRINGTGLLNAYRMGEVAKRLKEKCKSKAESCFKEEIAKKENYDFSGEKDEDLKRDAGRVFPSCAGKRGGAGKGLRVSECEDMGEIFKRLRKEVLLNPDSENFRILSCVYKEAGFVENAEGLERLALALGTEEEVRAKLGAILRKRESVSNDSLRLMLGMGGFEGEFNSSEFQIGLHIAGGIGEKGLLFLEKILEMGNLELQMAVLFSAGGMGEKGLPFLEKGFETGNPKLQMKALFSAGWIGEKALPLLEKGFETGNLRLQIHALASAGRVGEKALPLLEKGFETGNPRLQGKALAAAGGIGEKALPLLKKMLKNPNVDKKIKESIRNTIRDWQ